MYLLMQQLKLCLKQNNVQPLFQLVTKLCLGFDYSFHKQASCFFDCRSVACAWAKQVPAIL